MPVLLVHMQPEVCWVFNFQFFSALSQVYLVETLAAFLLSHIRGDSENKVKEEEDESVAQLHF